VKTWIVLVVAATVLIASAARGEEPAKEKLGLTEWSVVLLGSGTMMEELPSFVPAGALDARGLIGTTIVIVRGAEGQELDVSAGERQAVAAWPVAAGAEGVGGAGWRGTLSKTPKVEPRPVPQGHGWGRLRERGVGMYVNVVGGASERFLFLRAPARAEPRVSAHITSDAITLANSGEKPSGPVVVILNDGLSRNGARVGSIRPKEEVTLSRASMTEISWDDRETLGAAESAWRGAGLSEADAKSAVDAWREELLNRPGFLLITRIPQAEYDDAFPLRVKPEPAERVRAGLLFDTLADQKERDRWLVNLDQSVAKWVAQYAGDDSTQRSEALRKFGAAGELAEPFLRELAKDSDPAVAKAAGELLKKP
jgi:hypothetical protein